MKKNYWTIFLPVALSVLILSGFCLYGVFLTYRAFTRPVDYFCRTDHEIYQYLTVHGQELFEELQSQQSVYWYVHIDERNYTAYYTDRVSNSPFIYIQASDSFFVRSPSDGGGFAYSPDLITNLSSTFSHKVITYLDNTIFCYYPEASQ